MRLSAPSVPVFVISLLLAVLAVVGMFVAVPVLSALAGWIALAAYLVLATSVVMSSV